MERGKAYLCHYSFIKSGCENHICPPPLPPDAPPPRSREAVFAVTILQAQQIPGWKCGL